MGDTVPPSDIPDAFQKCFLDSEFSLGDEAQTHLQKRHEEIRARIAALPNPFQKATASDGADPALLEKRFTSGLDLDGYREWFAKGIAAGKSATALLDEWLAQFSDRAKPEVVQALHAVAAEF